MASVLKTPTLGKIKIGNLTHGAIASIKSKKKKKTMDDFKTKLREALDLIEEAEQLTEYRVQRVGRDFKPKGGLPKAGDVIDVPGSKGARMVVKSVSKVKKNVHGVPMQWVSLRKQKGKKEFVSTFYPETGVMTAPMRRAAKSEMGSRA